MSLRYDIKKNINTKTYIYFNPRESNHLDDIKLLLENDDKIYVDPNDEQLNANNSYKDIMNYIYRIITKTDFLCKGLNPKYILDSFDNVDAIIIIGSSINILPNGNIFGFALIEFNEKHNSIHIDVICSHIGIRYAGDILIKTIEDMCRKLLIKYIYLNSVNSAIPFYEKYGFIKEDELCDDMCLMIKSINNKMGGNKRRTHKQEKSRKIKKPRKTRKTRKSRKNYFKNRSLHP